MKSVAKKNSHGLHRFHEKPTIKAIFIRSGEPQDHGNLVVNAVNPPRHNDTKNRKDDLIGALPDVIDTVFWERT